ncbi:MAG: hypothetical protein JWL70_1690 [Acidimicrobiia bacterium]|nr:hypothetical protein [Acidimicrobiia bacterium]
MTSEVVDVRVDRATSLTITYDDGHQCSFPLPELRQICPCATCRGIRDAGGEVVLIDALAISDAELVGAWGISLTWSDGHNTGIYPWDALRRWCDERAG